MDDRTDFQGASRHTWPHTCPAPGSDNPTPGPQCRVSWVLVQSERWPCPDALLLELGGHAVDRSRPCASPPGKSTRSEGVTDGSSGQQGSPQEANVRPTSCTMTCERRHLVLAFTSFA